MRQDKKKQDSTIRFTVFYRDYLEQGKEFKPGLGAGVFCRQDYVYSLEPGKVNSALFQASLVDQERTLLDELFLVKTELVDVSTDDVVFDDETQTPRYVMREAFKRYRKVCEDALKKGAPELLRVDDSPATSLSVLISRCAASLAAMESISLEKLGQTLGFVQSVLLMRGAISMSDIEGVS